VDAEISKEFLKYYGLAYDVLRYQMWSEINSRLESVVGFMAPYLGLEGSTDEVKPKLREFAIQIRTFKRHTKDIWFAHILLNAKTRSNGH
jgi:hypothetical protein